MGLDWNPGNKPKPGHEAEFTKLFHQLDEVSVDAERDALFQEFMRVSITAFETLQAPRVGESAEADAWAREMYRKKAREGTEEEWLQKLRGFYVLALVPECDGLPRYSNGDPGGYVEPYSFRAKFLEDCEEIVGAEMLERAYQPMLSTEFLAYGEELRERVEGFAARHSIDMENLDINDFDGIDFKVDVVRSASRWCRFWAERGHILDPYF